MNKWKKKSKGNAKLHILEGNDKAIVVNFLGIYYNGIKYDTLDEAKTVSENEINNKKDL